MEAKLLRQIRVLQIFVILLCLSFGFLAINMVHPLLSKQSFKVLDVERLNVRERDGTLRAAFVPTRQISKKPIEHDRSCISLD